MIKKVWLFDSENIIELCEIVEEVEIRIPCFITMDLEADYISVEFYCRAEDIIFIEKMFASII